MTIYLLIDISDSQKYPLDFWSNKDNWLILIYLQNCLKLLNWIFPSLNRGSLKMSFSIPLSSTFYKKCHIFLYLYSILASTLKLDKFLRRLGRDVLQDRDNKIVGLYIFLLHLTLHSHLHLLNVNCYYVLA